MIQFSTIRPDPADIERLTELYRECRRATDMAIVSAKKTGRNKTVIYTAKDMHAAG